MSGVENPEFRSAQIGLKICQNVGGTGVRYGKLREHVWPMEPIRIYIILLDTFPDVILDENVV